MPNSNRASSAAFNAHVRPAVATIPTGIDHIDRALGGIPVGAITELVAPPFISAGQKSIQAQLLARATQEQVCALVDATDSFDPKSARAIGVNLQRLLWVRCSGRPGMKCLEQALKCADLLLRGSGGFGVIIVELAGIPQHSVRKVPLTTWFRFRAVVFAWTLRNAIVRSSTILLPHKLSLAGYSLTRRASSIRVQAISYVITTVQWLFPPSAWSWIYIHVPRGRVVTYRTALDRELGDSNYRRLARYLGFYSARRCLWKHRIQYSPRARLAAGLS